ncbi:MAG: choline dehydrogenase-like flavoprotein, partial [Arcticibacterium sp.]
SNFKQALGLNIHKMGHLRTGKDPKTSLLKKHNQFYSCKNLFVIYRAMMTSPSTQNP